jgi:hypothetical protein
MPWKTATIQRLRERCSSTAKKRPMANIAASIGHGDGWAKW